jgi:hypothetical protein
MPVPIVLKDISYLSYALIVTGFMGALIGAIKGAAKERISETLSGAMGGAMCGSVLGIFIFIVISHHYNIFNAHDASLMIEGDSGLMTEDCVVHVRIHHLICIIATLCGGLFGGYLGGRAGLVILNLLKKRGNAHKEC